MPVLPLVESSRLTPFGNLPLRSASATIAAAARSLTDPPGFAHSAFASTAAPASREIESRRSSGVLPMRSSSDSPAARGFCRATTGAERARLSDFGVMQVIAEIYRQLDSRARRRVLIYKR